MQFSSGGLCLVIFGAMFAFSHLPENAPACNLFEEFPDYFKRDATNVDTLVVVTFSDSSEYVRLMLLMADHPWKKNQERLDGGPAEVEWPRHNWCIYLGCDNEFHYSYSYRAFTELYRIRRADISDDAIVAAIKQQDEQARQAREQEPEINKRSTKYAVGYPRPKLAVEWLRMTGELDKSLIKKARSESE